MIKSLLRRKKKAVAVDPAKVIEQLNDFSPPSVLAFLRTPAKGGEAGQPLGRAVILRRESRFYAVGDHIFLSTPEGLKASDGTLLGGRGDIFSLQFLHRRVPHCFDCRVIGRQRLQPEIARSLDFRVLSAYKLLPLSKIRKEDKRFFLRYTLDNYGDMRLPLVPWVAFDVYVNPTNQQFPSDGAPAAELDIRLIPRTPPDMSRRFDASEAVEMFRAIMTKKPPGERQVHMTKVVKSQQRSSGRQSPEECYRLGFVDALGLDRELRLAVIYTRKSRHFDAKKDNPYNLQPGDRVLLEFSGEGYHEMLCEVREARVQNECLRPIAYPQGEGGLKVHPVEFSVGGALIESSPEFLKMMLDSRCPTDVDEHPTYEGAYWERLFEELKRPMIEVSFYPKLNFTENLEQFRPQLPFKINMIAQVARTEPVNRAEYCILHHGLRFAYDPLGTPLTWSEVVRWKLMHGFRDNAHFRELHSKISQAYGFLQHRKQTLDPTGMV